MQMQKGEKFSLDPSISPSETSTVRIEEDMRVPVPVCSNLKPLQRSRTCEIAKVETGLSNQALRAFEKAPNLLGAPGG